MHNKVVFVHKKIKLKNRYVKKTKKLTVYVLKKLFSAK